MLLQQIVEKLDGELVRLKSLRSVVAGLARTPAFRREAAFIPAPLPVAAVSVAPAAPEVAAEVTAEPQHRPVRGRPRKLPDGGPSVLETPARIHRRSRQAEPTALGKAASAGPVVISAAALVREREARQAVKAASPHQQARQAEPEVRPEIFARELAARWLSSPGKV